MRLTCPVCGARDRREFYYRGAALERPAESASGGEWDAYLHLRANPAGVLEEFWSHDAGCGAWVIVRRDTASHEVYAQRLPGDAT